MRVAAQTLTSTKNAPGFTAQEPQIKVESKLVLVPVFVYPFGALERPLKAEEARCYADDSSAFFALAPEQPFFPKRCDEREVRDLTLDDFVFFQDGEPQKIETVGKESWWLCARDSETWHVETSIAPRGVWSSADIGHSLWPETQSFYLLGYAPAASRGGCHRIRIEVHRPGVRIFARDEYCAEQTPSDLLGGTKIGRKLERELVQRDPGKIRLFLQAGAFHQGAGQQLVDVVVEFPWNQLNHSWDVMTGRLSASIGVLGAVYSKDGKLVARFSDLLWPSYWPTILKGEVGSLRSELALAKDDPSLRIRMASNILARWDPGWLPTRYETQFELPPGEYDLRVILSDGTKSGRAEVPVVVEKHDAYALALGSVFLSSRFRDAHVAEVETAAANFAPQYVPLVSKGVHVTPAGDTRFGPHDQLSAYFEIYEPHGSVDPVPQIQAHLRILDAKNGAIVKEFSAVDAATYMQPGSTTIPIAREVPIATLPKGEYRLEVQASDSAGRTTPWRAANFTITDKN